MKQTDSLEQKIKKINKILKDGEPGNITEDNSRGFVLSGYDPQYVIDAMNTVLGVRQWGFEDIYNKVAGGEAVAHIRAWVEYGEGGKIERTAYGSKKIIFKGEKQLTSFGDAKKSAQTDAIKKALSYFSIGNRAYHGKLKK